MTSWYCSFYVALAAVLHMYIALIFHNRATMPMSFGFQFAFFVALLQITESANKKKHAATVKICGRRRVDKSRSNKCAHKHSLFYFFLLCCSVLPFFRSHIIKIEIYQKEMLLAPFMNVCAVYLYVFMRRVTILRANIFFVV